MFVVGVDGPVIPDQGLPDLDTLFPREKDVLQDHPVRVARGRSVGDGLVGQVVLGDQSRPARQDRRRAKVASPLGQNICGPRPLHDPSPVPQDGKALVRLHVGEPGQVHRREVRGPSELLREVGRLRRPHGGKGPAGVIGAHVLHRPHPALRAEVVGRGQRPPSILQEPGIVRPDQVGEVHGAPAPLLGRHAPGPKEKQKQRGQKPVLSQFISLLKNDSRRTLRWDSPYGKKIPPP